MTLAVVLWLCLGLAFPIVMSFYSIDIASDAVEAAPSEAFSLSQPIALAQAPAVMLERGTAVFVDGNGKVVKLAEPGGQGQTAPSQFLKIYNGAVSFAFSEPNQARRDGLPASSFPTSPFAEALIAGRYETLSLRRSTLTIAGFFEEPETLTDVNADISLRRRGTVSIKGTARLRGEQIAIDATANTGQAEKSGNGLERVPLKLTIKGKLIDLNFDGRMQIAQREIELRGQGELGLPSGRRLARWFGSFWPTGAGLRDMHVRGQMHVTKQNLAFENAVARMDGNEATGVLGLRIRQPRPVLTGTLAFKAFDARPYFAAAEREANEALTWSSLSAGVLSVPLGMNLDVDLRISADKVQLGGFDLGKMATTLALKDGRLLADFTDIRIAGGDGGGQINADFTGFIPRVSIRGKLDQLELGSFTSTFAGLQLAHGKANIVADLAGSGSTFQDLINSLSGKIAVRSRTPGRLGLDLKALAETARARETTGWGDTLRGSTSYDALDLKLILKDGTLLTETAEAKTPEGSWTAVGVLNLLSDRIDVRLSQSGAGAGPSSLAAASQGTIELHGLAREPRARVATTP